MCFLLINIVKSYPEKFTQPYTYGVNPFLSFEGNVPLEITVIHGDKPWVTFYNQSDVYIHKTSFVLTTG